MATAIVIAIVAVEIVVLLARLRRRRRVDYRPSERIDGLHHAIYGRSRGDQ